ncbi:MAG: hypothetical protein K2Y18_08850 [Alphaproteobacteria bacterium]|nr:hypothetical protein [Alphaproteobacteria bacterium]
MSNSNKFLLSVAAFFSILLSFEAQAMDGLNGESNNDDYLAQSLNARGSSLTGDLMPTTDESLFRKSNIQAESGDKNGLVDSNVKTNNEASFSSYKKAAENGETIAMVYLGDYYLEAQGCDSSLEDKNQAVIWYERAALAGNVRAMVSLAGCLSKAVGLRDSPGNREKAFFWGRKAAELGDSNGMFFLASFLYNAIGCEESPDNKRYAIYWYERAALADNVYAMLALASCLDGALGCKDSPNNKRLAVFWFEKAALAGNVTSMVLLASRLYSAIGCEDSPKNKKGAYFWYEKAALAENIPSMGYLGICLNRAIGCEDSPENKRLAVSWLERAASAGDPESMVNLAVSLYRARGCEDSPENKDKAIHWLRKAAELGHVRAMINLGILFLEDPGYKDIPANNREAVKWLTKGMELGSKQCALDLGNAYFEGAKGVDRNNQLALVCFEKIKHNWTVANLIGAIYLGQKNYTKALESYLEARRQGISVSVGLINFLERKAALLNRRTSVASKTKKNVARDAAIASKQNGIEQDVRAVKGLHAQLLKQLEGKKGPLVEADGGSTTVEALLNKVHSAYVAFEQSFEKSSDLFEKRVSVDALTQILSGLEETLLVAEQEESNKIHMEALRKKAKVEQKLYLPMEIGRDESPTKEVKAQAEKTLAKNKDRRHTKKVRKHTNPTSTKGKKNSPALKSIKAQLVKGPFSDMKEPVKRTKSQIPAAAWDNVYKIRDSIRDASDMEDAIGKMKNLPGDFDFHYIIPMYAGIPNADLAFQMRINEQYRAIIAFVKVTVMVLEQGVDGKKSNIPIEKDVYKLYGDTIYITDPHVKA